MQRSCLGLGETYRPPSKTPAFAGGEPSGNPGPRAGCPLRGTPRGDGREQSLKTLPANCCDATHSETTCAQSQFRLPYMFFRGSAAELRLRVSGVTSTSVACVMNP